jgi:hypothetical protein
MRSPTTIIGIVLTVVGALMLAFQGLTYTTEETVVDMGPFRVEAEERKTVPLPRAAGAVTLGVGVILLVVGVRKSSKKE